GGLLAWLGAGVVGVPAMLLGLAALSACCLAGLPWLQPPEADRERKPSESAPASGLRSLGRYPYLRNLALLVALASLTEVLVDYVFKARTVAWLSGSGALIAFFGPFYTGLAALSLVAQTALTRPALERLGLSSTVALHPLSTALGTAVALAHPGLGSVLLARGATGVLRDSLFRSGYELLYTPLPPRTKRATKALVDVTADKAGAISGAGLALLLIGALPGGGEWALLGLAFVGGLAALIVARRLHAGYVAALGQSLRAGTVHVDLSDALDATTRATLTHALDRDSILAEIDALRSPDAERDVGDFPGEADPLVAAIADVRSGIPSRVRRAIRGVAPGETALVSHLIPLLVRNEVFVESVRYLRSCAPRCTGQLLDALLDPDVDPVVRRRVPRVLKGCPTQRVVDGLLAGLEDPVFSVRAECALVLFHVTGRAPELQVPPEKVFSTVARELASEGGDQRLLGHAFTLLALVLEREPLRIALHAFDSGDRRLRGTALEYLENVL
ncbi:MAG TPA: hypothetical protein VIC87_05890, partial [Vicinamibacteria bacterium]